MSKDTFWFRHDSNAKDDPKCILLIEQLGPEGYGIFWILIELLREQPEYKYPISLVPSIARRYNTTAEKVKTVISAYELFTIEQDQFFFSESLLQRMKALDDYKNALSEAGRRGAKARLEGGLSLAKRIEENGIEPNGVEEIGVQSNIFVTVRPKYANEKWIKIFGIDGLAQYYEKNKSSLGYPEHQKKFMLKNNGRQFNEFTHVFNSFNSFVEKQYQ